jgi:hypothetical protein
MNEEIPISTILVGVLGVLYFGYEVEKQRNKLREVFNVVERQESVIGAALEHLVETGQLKPYVPCPPA